MQVFQIYLKCFFDGSISFQSKGFHARETPVNRILRKGNEIHQTYNFTNFDSFRKTINQLKRVEKCLR